MPLDPVYLIHSDHAILVDRLVRQVRDEAVDPGLRAFNEEVIDGKPTADRILAAVRTMPMMGPCRLVWVKDVAGISPDDAAELAQYLAAPVPTAVLLMQTSKLDKRHKLPAAAAKRGFLHVLTAPRQVAPWLTDEAKRAQVAIAPNAVQRLVELVGDDLTRAQGALAQLALYTAGQPITVADVDEVIAGTREQSVFALTDAIGDGDAPRAHAAVAALFHQRESALGVVAMLARYVRQLSMIWELGQSGRAGDLASALGVPPFAVDRLKQQARRIRPPQLVHATCKLAEADRLLKGDPTQAGSRLAKGLGRALAERVILEACVDSLLPSRQR